MPPLQLGLPSSLMMILGGGVGVVPGRAMENISEDPGSRSLCPPTPWWKLSSVCCLTQLPFLSQTFPSDVFLIFFFWLSFPFIRSYFCLFSSCPPPLAFHFPLVFLIYILPGITYLMCGFSLNRVREQTAKD